MQDMVDIRRPVITVGRGVITGGNEASCEIELIEQGALFQVGKHGDTEIGARRRYFRPNWEGQMHVVIVVQRQAHLLEIVLALRPTGGLTGLLDRRKEQGDQYRDNRDDNQKLNQRKATASLLLGIVVVGFRHYGPLK